MLELLLAATVGVHPAPECPVRLEIRSESTARIFRPRAACPLGFDSTREAVRALLAHAGTDTEVRMHMGRIVEYPWLSALLEHAGGGTDNARVARTLRGIPELGHLFPGWAITALSVEKVLVRRGRPYDAILWLTLTRSAA
ncbi:MAG: hypothetical protein EXR31_03440 [Betaproteobacteria bacterium]|nr:hypothetical protein [Betaproteobacteria bacterium]